MGSKDYRTDYMHMRDRILYCRSFLRLAGKTQVYGTNFDDHTRNRLTHSLEVAQIAKTIATGLNKKNNSGIIDIDKIEAIALGHDLGHTPFGHAGERELNEIVNFKNKSINEILFPDIFDNESKLKAENRGFKHNWQSVRILKFLCREYIGGSMFNEEINTNMAKEVLKGILCHSSLCNERDFSKDKLTFYEESMNSTNEFSLVDDWEIERIENDLASKIVNLADEIAQRHHDIEDAISFHYLKPKDALNIIWGNEYDDVPQCFLDKRKEVEKHIDNEDFFLKKVSSIIVDYLVRNLVSRYLSNSNKLDFDENGKKVNKGMQERMSAVVLHSRSVQRMDSRGQFIIRNLFKAYASNPLQLPDNTLNAVFREYLRQHLWERNASDSLINPKIREKISNMLINEKGLDLFKHIHECRSAFNTIYNKTDDYYLDLANEYLSLEKKYDDISENIIKVNKTWFRICLMRVITDYISGMTDLYAETEYHKLYGMMHDIMA